MLADRFKPLVKRLMAEAETLSKLERDPRSALEFIASRGTDEQRRELATLSKQDSITFVRLVIEAVLGASEKPNQTATLAPTKLHNQVVNALLARLQSEIASVNSIATRAGLVEFARSRMSREHRALLKAIPRGEERICELVAMRIMARRAPAAKVSADAPFIAVAASTMTQTGIDYERHCMSRINACGWKTEMTRASGDFGVDLIAQRENSVNTLRVAVQCKRYSGAVGVDAVQQVHTGRDFYEAEHAVVISTMGYTRAAKALASRIGVELLVDREIEEYFGLLF